MLMEQFEGSNETLITKRRRYIPNIINYRIYIDCNVRVLEVHVPQWGSMFQNFSSGVMLFEYTEFEVSRAKRSMGQ